MPATWGPDVDGTPLPKPEPCVCGAPPERVMATVLPGDDVPTFVLVCRQCFETFGWGELEATGGGA